MRERRLGVVKKVASTILIATGIEMIGIGVVEGILYTANPTETTTQVSKAETLFEADHPKPAPNNRLNKDGILFMSGMGVAAVGAGVGQSGGSKDKNLFLNKFLQFLKILPKQ